MRLVLVVTITSAKAHHSTDPFVADMAWVAVTDLPRADLCRLFGFQRTVTPATAFANVRNASDPVVLVIA